jgi:LCP family protein required for cell wall assembly
MTKKLWVPPPPQVQPQARRRSEQLGRSRKRRRRPGGRVTGWLVTAGLVLALFVACLLLAAVATRFPARDSGRINLLLLGVDRRSGTDWTYRTDTILIASLVPAARDAGLLSIPRDLQVPIPGNGEDRINTANVWGYLNDYPGGGPALLKATIEANFSIPIDGYLMIDFGTFARIVDVLGGIDVDVPKTLHDTHYPDPRPGDPYAYKTIHFDPGLQHMDGERALEYARSRMSTTDFDRARRQQLILLAIRRRALRLGAVSRWPALAAAVLDGAQTDLDASELLALALLAARIDSANLKQAVLEPPLVSGYQRADGAAVQLPNWELIDPVLTDLFGPVSAR